MLISHHDDPVKMFDDILARVGYFRIIYGADNQPDVHQSYSLGFERRLHVFGGRNLYFFYVKKVHVFVFVFFLTFLPWTSSVLGPRLFFPPKLDLILHLKFELLLAACDGDKIAAKYSIKCYYEKTHGTENISRKIETSVESLISLLFKSHYTIL